MNDRRLIRLASDVLTADEFQVWVMKHTLGYGRRTGSDQLRITEDQWRHRIRQANIKVQQAIEEAKVA